MHERKAILESVAEELERLHRELKAAKEGSIVLLEQVRELEVERDAWRRRCDFFQDEGKRLYCSVRDLESQLEVITVKVILDSKSEGGYP